jgi:hypothetical protein
MYTAVLPMIPGIYAIYSLLKNDREKNVTGVLMIYQWHSNSAGHLICGETQDSISCTADVGNADG